MPVEVLFPKPSSPVYQNPNGNIRPENRRTQISYSGVKLVKIAQLKGI